MCTDANAHDDSELPKDVAHAHFLPSRRPHVQDHATEDCLCLFLAVLLVHVIEDTLSVRDGGLDVL